MHILTIHIPAKNAIHAETAKCVFNLLCNYKKIRQYTIVQPIMVIGKSNIDMIRSEMITAWYDKADDTDIFMFLDSDQTFEPRDIENMIDLISQEKADVVVGDYSRSDGTQAALPKNPTEYNIGQDLRLVYGPTGFMMITKPILRKIHDRLKIKYKDLAEDARIWMSDHQPRVIPFFLQSIRNSILGGGAEWAPEDYSFCYLVNECGGTIIGYESNTIGHEVYYTLYLDNNAVQKKFTTFENTKSIVYYTYDTAESWNPIKREKYGVGGSETAVIELSEYWASQGYQVTVYGNIGDSRMEHRGVTYLPFSFFRAGIQYNILIIWRGIDILKQPIRCRHLILDLHDVPRNQANYSAVVAPYVNQGIKTSICVKSQYHRRLFNTIGDNLMRVIPNGVPSKYISTLRTAPFTETDVPKLIYSSSYDRGLESMLKWGWPLIKHAIPRAELHIYYGWNSSDASAKKYGEDQHWVFKDKMVGLFNDSPDVYEHGRVHQDELLRKKSECMLHYYVGWYSEIDCISVRESALVGCIPIVNTIGCFTDANKDYCIKVATEPGDDQHLIKTQQKAAGIIIELLKDLPLLNKMRAAMFTNPHLVEETWENIGEQWCQGVLKNA